MAPRVTVRPLAEHEYDLWRELVRSSPQGSIYALPEYLDILCSVTGDRFSLLGAFFGDELAAGIPLYEHSSAIGRSIANRLLLYYNGLLLKTYETRYPSKETSRQIALMTALADWLDTAAYERIILHSRGMPDARVFWSRGWTARPSYTYVMDLTDLTRTWNRIEQNLRRLVKRCESQGITLSDDDNFDSFFAMHEETHLRKGAPLYLPRERFEMYFRRLLEGGWCRLYQARTKEGKAVAAQLVLLGPKPISHTVCAGADAEYLHLGTTPFLRWKSCEQIAVLGYTGNDLTDAALNPVTRFKSQLGGTLTANLVLQRADSQRYRRHQTKQQLLDRIRHYAGRALALVRRQPR